MEVQALYDLAAKQNIEILQYPMERNGSMSIMLGADSFYIGLDKSVQDGRIQERTHLAHELGHCVTGSFYNIHSPFSLRERQEHKADKWAIKRLIPRKKLKAAMESGHTEIWELAEHFGVTEDFMRKAICYYVNGNLATELYF